MLFDIKILLTLFRTVASVELAEEPLARFDALSDYAKRHGVSLFEASKAAGLPISYQSLLLVTGGCLYNWIDGGGDAALTLPEADKFDAQIAPDIAPERELVKWVAHATRLLAWADIGELENLREVGKTLLKIWVALLKVPGDHYELAIALCLLSRDMLERFDDPDGKLAQLYAYRQLVTPTRLPFLPDLPPAKYPPPLAPDFEENTVLHLALDFIQKAMLDQKIDLEQAARELQQDPESAIKNEMRVQIGDEDYTLKVELAFGSDLLRWAFKTDDEFGADIGPHERLSAMLSLLCENRHLLERFRDDDYGFVYEVIYLGLDESPDRLSLAMKLESFKHMIRIVVGLTATEVRMNSSRDHIFSGRKTIVLQQIAAVIEAQA